jgi:hypothetical protein
MKATGNFGCPVSVSADRRRFRRIIEFKATPQSSTGSRCGVKPSPRLDRLGNGRTRRSSVSATGCSLR